MSATPAAPGLDSGAIPVAAPGRAAGRAGAWAPRRLAGVSGILLLAALVLAGAVLGGEGGVRRVQRCAGTLLRPAAAGRAGGRRAHLVIPPGAAADQQAGGRGYVMPDVIRLTVGDTIVLRNDDDAPHMILYAFLMPGETDERTFTEPGSEVYSSGCGVHAASILNFTTIFVSEPA